MSYPQMRQFMKTLYDQTEGMISDQAKKVPYPALQKPLPEDAPPLIDLPDPEQYVLDPVDFTALLKDRQSWRKYSQEPLSLIELSFLLFATQGVLQF